MKTNLLCIKEIFLPSSSTLLPFSSFLSVRWREGGDVSGGGEEEGGGGVRKEEDEDELEEEVEAWILRSSLDFRPANIYIYIFFIRQI